MSENSPEAQIDDGLGSGQPQSEQPEPQEPAPVFVYAIAMMADGEVKLVTELPFMAHRKALMSDVSMTAGYVLSAIKDGKL